MFVLEIHEARNSSFKNFFLSSKTTRVSCSCIFKTNMSNVRSKIYTPWLCVIVSTRILVQPSVKSGSISRKLWRWVQGFRSSIAQCVEFLCWIIYKIQLILDCIGVGLLNFSIKSDTCWNSTVWMITGCALGIPITVRSNYQTRYTMENKLPIRHLRNLRSCGTWYWYTYYNTCIMCIPLH